MHKFFFIIKMKKFMKIRYRDYFRLVLYFLFKYNRWWYRTSILSFYFLVDLYFMIRSMMISLIKWWFSNFLIPIIIGWAIKKFSLMIILFKWRMLSWKLQFFDRLLISEWTSLRGEYRWFCHTHIMRIIWWRRLMSCKLWLINRRNLRILTIRRNERSFHILVYWPVLWSTRKSLFDWRHFLKLIMLRDKTFNGITMFSLHLLKYI